MRTQGQAEQLLMDFYGAALPSLSTPSPETVHEHQPSVALLKVIANLASFLQLIRAMNTNDF